MDTDHLRRQLEQQLNDSQIPFNVDANGDLAVELANTTTYVRPQNVGGRACVRIWAITNVDVNVTDELTRYLATETATLAYGGFELHEAGRVALSHTLLGGFLQRTELEVAVTAMAATAEQYAAQIKSRFGGKLFGEP